MIFSSFARCVRTVGMGAAAAPVAPRAGLVFCAGSATAPRPSTHDSTRQWLIEKLIEFGMRESYRELKSISYTLQDDPCPQSVLPASYLIGEFFARF